MSSVAADTLWKFSKRKKINLNFNQSLSQQLSRTKKQCDSNPAKKSFKIEEKKFLPKVDVYSYFCLRIQKLDEFKSKLRFNFMLKLSTHLLKRGNCSSGPSASSMILLFYYLTLQQNRALVTSLCMQLHWDLRRFIFPTYT